MKFIHMTKNFYSGLSSIGELFQPLFLFAIRLYWGFAFQQAGCNKLLNIKEAASFFSNLHIPFPTLNAYLVGGIECLGGWLLILGLGTRLAALPLAIIMSVALYTAHHVGASQIFSNQSAFMAEAPVTFLLTVLTLFAFGPGAISLDYGLENFSSRR